MANFTPSLEHLDALDKQFVPSVEHLDKLDNPEDEDEELTGVSGVATDVMDMFGNALNAATNLPDTLEKSGKYIEDNPAESIGHNLGQFGAGVGDVLKGAANTPADLTEYLLKKRLHPAQLFGGEGKQESKPIHSEQDLAESLGKSMKATFPRQLADQLIQSITKTLPRIPEDTGVEKALGLQPKPDSGDTLFRKLPDVLTLGAGGLQLGKAAFKGAGKVSKLLNKPAAVLEEAQKAENALKTSMEEAKSATGDAQINAAHELSEQKNNLMETHEQKAAEVESMIPNEPESEIKSQTVKHFRNVRKQLKQHFDTQYDEYKSGPGSNAVVEPLTSEQLTPALKTLSPAGREMAEGLAPGKVELNILNPETKKPFVLNIPAENGTVQDYIEMMRTARDARSKLSRDMSKPHVTRADELQMSKEADSLKTLQDTVEKKIKESVTPDEWKQFQGIQKDYKDLYRPFTDNNDLFNAWFHKIDSGGIFKELNQPAYSRLFQSLHNDPEFNQLALSSALRGNLHPLTETNPVLQSKKIDQLLAHHNADVNRFMSPEQFAALKSLSSYGKLIGSADKSLQALSKSMLSKAIKAYDLSKAVKLNPEAEKLLSDIGSKQLSQKEINRRMKAAGIETDEARAKFDARKHANQMLKKALSIGGISKVLGGF